MKVHTGYEAAISGNELRDGDTVTMANQWAKVVISVEIDGNACIFKVTGDVVQFRNGVASVRVKELAFRSARHAFNNAMASIAFYAKGRAD